MRQPNIQRTGPFRCGGLAQPNLISQNSMGSEYGPRTVTLGRAVTEPAILVSLARRHLDETNGHEKRPLCPLSNYLLLAKKEIRNSHRGPLSTTYLSISCLSIPCARNGISWRS